MAIDPSDNPYFRTGRPTLYRAIQMRSRLEASWAAYLDDLRLAWAYEPVCFASATGQYLPDFRLVYENTTYYVEIKGVFGDTEALRRRMEIVWASEPTAYLVALEGPPRTPGTPEDQGEWDQWWWQCKGFMRGWQTTWTDGHGMRSWELYPGGDPYETLDYEVLLEGSDYPPCG